MNRIFMLLCLTLIIPMLQSCATAPKRIPMRDDPLIGKIVDTSTGQFITFKTLMDKITSHDIIYLSEKHDNPMQHAIQHRIIQELIDHGRLPALGFEFFAMEAPPHLLNFLDSARIAHTATQESVIEKNLRRKLGWEKQSDTMAHSITRLHDPATPGPVVVIMGNGHTEYGLGVIDRMTAINKELSQTNLAMTEITREPSELTTYLSLLDIEGFKAVPQADFLWFTQRVSYKDPCLEFKRVFEKMKSRKKKNQFNTFIVIIQSIAHFFNEPDQVKRNVVIHGLGETEVPTRRFHDSFKKITDCCQIYLKNSMVA